MNKVDYLIMGLVIGFFLGAVTHQRVVMWIYKHVSATRRMELLKEEMGNVKEEINNPKED